MSGEPSTGERSTVALPQPDLFRLLVDSVEDYAIFLLDTQGNVQSWNAGAQRTKGYTADEIIGRHFSAFYTDEDRANGKPKRALAEAVAHHRFEDESWRLRKDGTRFWANVVITALFHEGKLVGFAKVTRDLTERLRAEQERAQLVAAEASARAEATAAAAAAEARESFINVAAHELKTPITALRGLTQLALRHLLNDRVELERLRRVLDGVEDQTRRMAWLVTRLLEATRAQSDELAIVRQEVDLTTLLRRLVEEAQSRDSAHVFILDAPETCLATIDAFRIGQVVENLLDNAVKFSPAGGPVEVGLSDGDEVTRIVVRDHGVGVPPHERHGMFERFHRAHGDDYRSGMGLGLFLSRRIVELHEGEISAEFPEDGGVRIQISIPNVQRDDVPPPSGRGQR